jgi:hypothetical protein
MKKIINRKVYNTETAELLHAWCNRRAVTDFSYVEEALYRTKKGAFFLYGSGGAMSGYAVSHGNTCGGGSDIAPLDKDEALRWLEKHGGEEVLEKLFPEELEEA